MKSGQKGFTVVETLLVLILLAILGFTGYYVYHTQKSANTNYDSASKTASSSSATTSSSKFMFKELSVDFEQPATLKGLAYQNQNGFLYLYDDNFINALKKCSDYKVGDIGGGFGAVSKIEGQYPANPTFEDGNLLKQFPTFYIGYGVPNGNGCADLSQSENLNNVAKTESAAFSQAFQKTAKEVK